MVLSGQVCKVVGDQAATDWAPSGVGLLGVSQDAWTGVCIMTASGNFSARRSMALCPRCDDPLSTTQNTRSGDAYGSWVLTCLTSAVDRFDAGRGVAPAMDLGPVDVVGGQVGQCRRGGSRG